MRSRFMIIALAALLASGCTYHTEHGPCVGAFDAKRPDRVYKVHVENIFWAVVGFGLIYPPIKVLVDATFCPVGKVEGAAP